MAACGDNRTPFNLVLVHPEIPQNTGGIGRLCVSTDSCLHLIKPFGFSLDDRYVKRAGMDYWAHVDLKIYEDWDEFIERNPAAELYFFTTKSTNVYWGVKYPQGAYLVFGNESSGLPENFYQKYRDRMFTIPMGGKFCRSLNLANSTAIVLYEGLRQQELNHG